MPPVSIPAAVGSLEVVRRICDGAAACLVLALAPSLEPEPEPARFLARGHTNHRSISRTRDGLGNQPRGVCHPPGGLDSPLYNGAA
jgi:hypothetical protein